VLIRRERPRKNSWVAPSPRPRLKLLDWTGRQIRRDHKKGHIPVDLAPIMERVGLSGELWCDLVKRFGKIFKRVAGKPESLAREASLRGRTGYRTGSSPVLI